MGMWPSMGGLIPGAGPTGIIPGGEGPLISIMGRPPTWGAGVMPVRGGPEGLGEVGSWLLQEEQEQRMEWEGSFRVEIQSLFCQSSSGLALPSFLV